MPVQITSKKALGSVVTVKVGNSDGVPRQVTVSLRVSVAGLFYDLVSDQTQIPAGATGTVLLQAPGTVEFIADSPDPTVMEE